MDLAPLAQRLLECGLMDKAFQDMSRDDVLLMIQTIFETCADDDIVDNARRAQNLYAYRTIAPCPRRDWHFVYRGQCCVRCPDKDKGCVSWPSLELPANIRPLKKEPFPLQEK